MFRPLAWTKTSALMFSSLLSIILVPVLMPLFIRGRQRPESENPAVKVTQADTCNSAAGNGQAIRSGMRFLLFYALIRPPI